MSWASSLRAEFDLIVVGQCRIDYMPMLGFCYYSCDADGEIFHAEFDLVEGFHTWVT